MAPIAMEVCSIKGYWPVLRLEVWKSPLLGFICKIKALKCYSWKYLFSHHLITSPHLLGTLENMHNCSSNRWESVSTQINLESHHTAVAAATVVEHIQQYITSQSYLLHTYAIISVVVLVVVGVAFFEIQMNTAYCCCSSLIHHQKLLLLPALMVSLVDWPSGSISIRPCHLQLSVGWCTFLLSLWWSLALPWSYDSQTLRGHFFGSKRVCWMSEFIGKNRLNLFYIIYITYRWWWSEIGLVSCCGRYASSRAACPPRVLYHRRPPQHNSPRGLAIGPRTSLIS